MRERYWSQSKARLVHREVEQIDVLFDPLSTESHFLSEYHIAILEQIPESDTQAISFNELLARVKAANDVEEGGDLTAPFQTALDQLVEKTLVDKAFDPQ